MNEQIKMLEEMQDLVKNKIVKFNMELYDLLDKITDKKVKLEIEVEKMLEDQEKSQEQKPELKAL